MSALVVVTALFGVVNAVFAYYNMCAAQENARRAQVNADNAAKNVQAAERNVALSQALSDFARALQARDSEAAERCLKKLAALTGASYEGGRWVN